MAKWFLATAALSAILATSSLASDWSEKRGSIYKPPGEGPHATGGDTLPDGHIASARKGDISKAWYTQPTSRYRHAFWTTPLRPVASR